MARGRLRIYLGAAPGVGKTFAMLGEGHRRLDRCTDVAIGLLETHGRIKTAAEARGLEVVPRQTLHHKGAAFTDMDLDGVIARRPAVALVDELAHTNVPGCRHEKRWQDVEELLAAGIDVITTLNVQHLESLNDVVQRITGVRQRETVPDEVVRRADQIELVDMSPEALRRRMAHGNVYPPEKVDAALSRYFRVGNLTALRELALLWLADEVDEGLRRYREAHGISGSWATRERVVVALTGGPEGETLLRRAARIASRAAGGELFAVHVHRSDGLKPASAAELSRLRSLVESVGGTFHTVVGDEVAGALLDFARSVDATQLVVGVSRRGRLATFLEDGVGERVVRMCGDIDVHIVPHQAARRGIGLPPVTRSLSRRRRVAGYLLALVGVPSATLLLAQLREGLSLTSDMLVMLLLVVVVALVGGLWPALVAAVAGVVLLNWFFTPPYYTLTISEQENVLALIVFVLVAVSVSWVVSLAARRTKQAARSSAEAATLSAIAGAMLRERRDAVDSVLTQACEVFGQRTALLLEPDPAGGWTVLARAGEPAPDEPLDPDTADAAASASAVTPQLRDHGNIPMESGFQPGFLHDHGEGGGVVLALYGRVLRAEEHRVLGALAAQAAAAWRQRELAEQVEQVEELAEAERMRTALLAAVSHDLRTPLASIKAAVTSLRSSDVTWSPADEAELLATIDESTDQLDDLVGNLLAMSRVATGALAVQPRPVGLEEVVPRALVGLDGGSRVRVEVPEDLPRVDADPGLLERVVANLVANALRYSPDECPPLLRAGQVEDHVDLHVVDRGPGVSQLDRDRMFEPFQRLGDRHPSGGVGLGLAVARGFTEAMGGTITPEDTPGGGLTMVVSLPVAA